MKKNSHTNILDVRIDTFKKTEAIKRIETFLKEQRKFIITTPNPEICLYASKHPEYREILNQAELNVPDGGGLQWAATYLNNQRGIKNARFLNIPIMFIDWLYTAARFTFSEKYRSSVIPETISGADLAIDIAKIAAKQNLSIFLFGGKEGVAKKAAANLQKKFPKLRIAGTYSGEADERNDARVTKIINDSKADIVFVALGAPKQEFWIKRNFSSIRSQLAMGVGGTLDFLAGEVSRAPEAYQKRKIEWLWRLKAEPWRKERIKNAVYKFTKQVYFSKIYEYRPYRPNVLCVIFDKKGEFLLLNNSYIYKKSGEKSHWQLLQGGKRPYESNRKAALRESKEEMGSGNLTYLGEAEETYSYEWPLRGMRLRRPYRGQKQVITFLRYEGDRSDVKIDPQEHSDFKWVQKKDILKELHPIRRTVAKIALKELNSKNFS